MQANDRLGSKTAVPLAPVPGLISAMPQRPDLTRALWTFRVVPCMDGAHVAREKNLTLSRNVRVQPCIRPLNAAVMAAGPDVIH